MEGKLKKGLTLLAILSIPAGFLSEHDHAVFWWHRLPFWDALVGGLGAIILMILIKGVALFASKKENFYD